MNSVHISVHDNWHMIYCNQLVKLSRQCRFERITKRCKSIERCCLDKGIMSLKKLYKESFRFCFTLYHHMSLEVLKVSNGIDQYIELRTVIRAMWKLGIQSSEIIGELFTSQTSHYLTSVRRKGSSRGTFSMAFLGW